MSLPYVTTRTSKSGLGIHLLVFLNPQPETPTHTDHANYAKQVLSRMSDDSGFDFHIVADTKGSVLWHWQKGMSDDGMQTNYQPLIRRP